MTPATPKSLSPSADPSAAGRTGKPPATYGTGGSPAFKGMTAVLSGAVGCSSRRLQCWLMLGGAAAVRSVWLSVGLLG